MNVLEKAEKALEYLKVNERTAKSHELQAAVGTLGRCLGVLGSRSNCARHFANLLSSAIPILLSLASNDSAEIRLVGDEALNRAVVGGFAFHSHKTNIIIQNLIEHTRNARWIRAALGRICLGECWLRPGVGKIRVQAQILFPKLSQIVRETDEIQLIVEALEHNLPRILIALGEYTTDEEISDLSKALLCHVETSEPAVRRGISTCVAHLCEQRQPLLTNVLENVFEKLWPMTADSLVIVGWFSVIKAVFQYNDISKLTENDLFSVQEYLELYHLCIYYIDQSTTEHNIQNTVMECLTTLLSQAKGEYKRALLSRHPRVVCLDERSGKGHKRNISSSSVILSKFTPNTPLDLKDNLELSFSGALQLGSLLQLNTPSLSVEDLTIHTPDSRESETEMDLEPEQLSKDLSEKLEEMDVDKESEQVDGVQADSGYKINIGSLKDDDVPLKYCARFLASKFLLTGNKGSFISDRSIRVSVKASALNCLSEILHVYPHVMLLYLDKDADTKTHNISGSSDGTDLHQDHMNDFILERNVCYQDSLSDSFGQDLSRSIDSQPMSKKDKSSEKSMESVEQKSSLKDVNSASMDSKARNDLMVSAMTDSTNPNMTNSNFTTNSNMTGSNDPMSTGYPMSSSGDVLSSSIDLDMKFDHFGESTTNLDNLNALKELNIKEERKRPLKRTDELQCKDTEELIRSEDSKNSHSSFECQHMLDVFVLLEGHSDPQIRGLVRVCIGSFLAAALDCSHGDYGRWKNYAVLPKDLSDCMAIENLINIILKGLSDKIHSTVTHTLASLNTISTALCDSTNWPLLIDILNYLIDVENNNYWLCRVNLCRLYEKLPYQKLFLLHPGYHARSKLIFDSLVRLLADQDQKVRNAASQTIASIISVIYPSKRHTPTTMLTEMAKQHSKLFSFDHPKLSLDLARNMHFYNDLPDELRGGGNVTNEGSLKTIVGDLVGRLMSSSCKYYSQGLLETLQAVAKKWSPWQHPDAYDQGILCYCLDQLDYCNGSVVLRTLLLDLCSSVYPVEIHNVMRHKTTNRDIFERDTNNVNDKWQHLEDDRVASLSEKFLQVTLKMLNVLVHLIEEVNPNVHLNKSGIALPGSPVRRKTQDSLPRRGSAADDDKVSMRKKLPLPATSLKANLAGHFFNEPFYMKFYENLRATYSNHKINLDSKNSTFYKFLSTTLKCLSVQLELATEREYGSVTEEILFYLKVIMPYCPDRTVYCVTQLLKCLFGTNMVNQYNDFLSIRDKSEKLDKLSFFEDVMLINSFSQDKTESRRTSISSNASQKLSLDTKNPRIVAERQLLINMENFAKNKSDRKWNTNKKELERYIRLFEPVVIQSLKSYTMQNDIPLQCQVLSLLNQLLTLRVNYCMLDSDQIFIGFLMKQLDLVEQHEIPNCCDLVNSILSFLVQLSSSRHHTKQLIEIPKLIQLCDGLMASGAHSECIAGLEPVAVKVFSSTGGSVLGRIQQQEAQATREVLFYMLQKTMHRQRVLDLVSCVLSLSQEHPESYYRCSELASDTLLSLLSQRSVELDTAAAVRSLERLLDVVYRDVLLEQSRVETMLRILFTAPPDQATTPFKQKLRYLSIIMVLLRKVLVLIPETEILLSIDYLKSTAISPQSIFFNVKTDVDPLNVQNVNENCANLSPDVILVRFLFKTITYALIELDNSDVTNLDFNSELDKDQSRVLLYSVCVNIIVQVKHMLHLIPGCPFPLSAKTAQGVLRSEQSALNTGLYSPDENIPLRALAALCVRAARRAPLLAAHWAHLLVRLNFVSHEYWQKLIGFDNTPLWTSTARSVPDIIQVACVLAYCEHFVENGLSEAVHLSWLLVHRTRALVALYHERAVRGLVASVHGTGAACALLLQAVAASCQGCLTDEFALNTYKILSLCHESQSGALVFLICRIIGKLEPAVAVRFAKLGIDRCKMLKEMSVDEINAQLSKEDVQVALELLQRDKVHVRYSSLVVELNSLATSVFDLSPLDLSQERAVNPQYIVTTDVDADWLVCQLKTRCCQSDCTLPKIGKQNELAHLLSNLTADDLTTIMLCPEFDRKLVSTCFKVSRDNYLREFLKKAAAYDNREYERELLRQQNEMKSKDELTSSIDSNKLNVVNTLHVFKKSDNKDSKSQFFIPMSDNLEISNEETDLVMPELPDLYRVSIKTLDKSLSDIIRLFPKQNRPLSQSDNFNLNIEQTIDRYTRRCHQVFQDKLFYQEFVTIQTILTGFLDSVQMIMTSVDEVDCDLLDKCFEDILPSSLCRNLAVFSVMSLQYLSFLIKNKKLVESPIHAEVSFRDNTTVTENVVVDNIIIVTVENVSKSLGIKQIWSELNLDGNINRIHSAISCLYAIVKYLVKDTKPLVLKNYIQIQDDGPKTDMILTGDKLVTLLQYWEENFYIKAQKECLQKCYRKPVESLLVSLARLDAVSNIALIPPIAWSSVDVVSKKDETQKIDLPLQALQDIDVLEAFLFRANLLGWSSRKQFEELWAGVLGALRGDAAHWAARGAGQLLCAAGPAHVPRRHRATPHGMQRLQNILIGTSAYKLFDDVNLERIPLMRDSFDGHHYAQFSTEYLKLASDITDKGSFKVKREIKRMKKTREIDVNSCLQILMDVTSQMLEPKAPTGLATRVALINCMIHAQNVFNEVNHWCWTASQLISLTGPAHSALVQYSTAGRALLLSLSHCLCVYGLDGTQEMSSVHQKLLKSLTSSYAPLRQAALHGCLLQLCGDCAEPNPSQELVAQLNVAVRQYLTPNSRLSLYEQSLYWTVLFTLVELGHPDLMNIAVDFLLKHPRHYCADLIVKGITNVLPQQVLPKDLKNNIIEKLLDNMKAYCEQHVIQILMVYLFSADNKLLSPKLTSDVSNMDPDVLMNSMERITLLYKVLRQTEQRESKIIITSALKYFLRETLPPAATLSRVVMEFLESCKDAERTGTGILSDKDRLIDCSILNCEVVFEVFETSLTQDQLPVLSGWIFEALCHLLSGKITQNLLPYCVFALLVSASSNQFIRKIAPLSYHVLRQGLLKYQRLEESWGIFKEFLCDNRVTMSFTDRRLLCIVALKSNFSGSQLARLKELCESNDCLQDLMQCLSL